MTRNYHNGDNLQNKGQDLCQTIPMKA